MNREQMAVCAEKAETFAEGIEAQGHTTPHPLIAKAIIWLLRHYAVDLRDRQKETPDSQKPGAEGGNCK